MSIESWKQEYYTNPSLCTNDRERAEHTKKKYIGARKENLDRHGLIKQSKSHFIYEAGSNVNRFAFDGGSCSFCCHYLKEVPSCILCPLSREGNACENDFDSAWWRFCKTDDPESMITLMDTIISKCDEDGVYRQ